MSATKFGRGKFAQKHFGYAPLLGTTSPPYPINQAVYFKTTSITLAWYNPLVANLYQLQVSLNPDFSGTDVYASAVLTDNLATFTDSSTNNVRRYWRWRWSANSGSNWSRWSQRGSYWLNTSGAENVTVARNSWALINPSPVTDRAVLGVFPMHVVTPAHLYRTRSQNRLGTMLSEYITMKDKITLAFDESRWLQDSEFSEIVRFNGEVKTFFLAMFNDVTLGQPVSNIWKVQYESDPELSMMVAGRQDLRVGELTFEEV